MASAVSPHILRHIHIPTIIPYPLAQRLQSHFFQQQLDYRAALSSSSSPSSSPTQPPPPPPPPTILSFTPEPVYTLGRRESLSTLSPTQRLNLLAPLPSTTTLAPLPPSNPSLLPTTTTTTTTSLSSTPLIHPTARGGLTTFHGPGQLLLYPILYIKSRLPLHPQGLTVRRYVRELEGATIRTLARYGVSAVRTSDPGVWAQGGERKVAALGVHLRRNVSCYGVGLNVCTDLRWFERIVACGLVGKGVTSLKEMVREGEGEGKGEGDGEGGELDPNGVVDVWVEEFVAGLWGEGGERVRRVSIESLADELPEDVMRGLEKAESGK